MYLTQSLHKALQQCPERTATVCDGRRHSYAEWVPRVARVAGALQGLGVAPGDRVGILALGSDRYLETIYGCWWRGAVINPVNIRWSPREIAYSLDDCGTRVLLVDRNFVHMVPRLGELSEALEEVIYLDDDAPADLTGYESWIADAPELDDQIASHQQLAAILYTGGTTGAPKGVMLSHRNLYSGTLGQMAAVQRSHHPVALYSSPLFHVAGMASVVQIAVRQGTHVILPGFDPAMVLDTIEREGVEETFLVPTMLRMLLDHPDFSRHDLSALKYLRYGASPMDEALLLRAMEVLPGAEFSQSYGMTELSPVISILSGWHHTAEGRRAGKLKSAGYPLPNAEVRIVDENDNDVPTGQVGEIIARGPMVMEGYWNKPEQTAEALRNGWMHTGDGGYMDEDGFIYVVDRIKDMIVTGGENVYSAEVENALLKMPEVAQCAVIGVPDERWGERVHAVVVTAPGQQLDEQRIDAHCRDLIAGYKCPKSIEFRDALPMSGAGKILKYELRKPFWEGRQRRVS
ncbi:acyl-CoA synthetase [Alloalcanivorax xenomutans]|uniref:acyl-CoA synthetase n=1 Tax=Alloalcanivorax xenomutans TaxID=1094342 RepID=UPI00047CFCD3